MMVSIFLFVPMMKVLGRPDDVDRGDDRLERGHAGHRAEPQPRRDDRRPAAVRTGTLRGHHVDDAALEMLPEAQGAGDGGLRGLPVRRGLAGRLARGVPGLLAELAGAVLHQRHGRAAGGRRRHAATLPRGDRPAPGTKFPRSTGPAMGPRLRHRRLYHLPAGPRAEAGVARLAVGGAGRRDPAGVDRPVRPTAAHLRSPAGPSAVDHAPDRRLVVRAVHVFLDELLGVRLALAELPAACGATPARRSGGSSCRAGWPAWRAFYGQQHCRRAPPRRAVDLVRPAADGGGHLAAGVDDGHVHQPGGADDDAGRLVGGVGDGAGADDAADVRGNHGRRASGSVGAEDRDARDGGDAGGGARDDPRDPRDDSRDGRLCPGRPARRPGDRPGRTGPDPGP